MRRLALLFIVVVLAGCAGGPRHAPLAGQRYALIQTKVGRSAQRIFPVEIYSIDGREVSRGPGLRKVAPGVHTIKARARVNRDLIPGTGRGNSAGGDTLTHNFQSGRRYFVGLKADKPRSADWELVIWKIEDVEAGTLDLESRETKGRP